ncbi:glycoside hydrolase family 26 protein [Geodermatophilus sp. SYSU D01119]
MPLGRGLLRDDDVPELVTRCRFGAWAATGGGPVEDHRALEARLGAALPVFSWFQALDPWDTAIAEGIAGFDRADPYDCMVCLEAWDTRLADVVAGERDDYFRRYFDGARTYPGRVVVRLLHEANGNWYPWSVAHDGDAVTSTGQWQEAWRRIVGIARGQGAANVTFMFCANAEDVGGVPVEDYWPGSEWVDVVGVDGYNWGWDAAGSPDVTAEELLDPMYRRLTALHPTAEFMVGELGCAAHPGKAGWYEALYRSRRFPRLTQVAFFHEAKEQDWRLDSDEETLRTNRRYLARAPR